MILKPATWLHHKLSHFHPGPCNFFSPTGSNGYRHSGAVKPVTPMVINMKRVQQLSSSDFSREVYLSPIPVVVDVYADWCGPCRAIAPLLERLAEHYDGRIRFVKVNIDEDPEVAQAFQVEGVPTLLFFRDGQLTDRVVGLADPRQLVAQLERHASGSAARI